MCLKTHTHTHTFVYFFLVTSFLTDPGADGYCLALSLEFTSPGHCFLCGLASRLSFPYPHHSHVFFIPYNRSLKVEVSVNIIIGIWGGLWKERSRSKRARAWERGKQGLRERHPLHLPTVVPGRNELLLEARTGVHILPGH